MVKRLNAGTLAPLGLWPNHFFPSRAFELVAAYMNLLPRELERVQLHAVGSLAQKRLARGVRLNLTEATALIATVLQELIRDGKHSVADLMSIGAYSAPRSVARPARATPITSRSTSLNTELCHTSLTVHACRQEDPRSCSCPACKCIKPQARSPPTYLAICSLCPLCCTKFK